MHEARARELAAAPTPLADMARSRLTHGPSQLLDSSRHQLLQGRREEAAMQRNMWVYSLAASMILPARVMRVLQCSVRQYQGESGR
jgi:hypothetical protein